MKTLLFCCATVVLTAGCAAPQADTESPPRAEPQYQTGSNIPKKGKSGDAQVYDREALERARTQLPPTPRGGLGGGSP